MKSGYPPHPPIVVSELPVSSLGLQGDDQTIFSEAPATGANATRDHGKSFRIRRYAVAVLPLVETKYTRFHHTMNGCSQKFEGVFFAYYYIAHINFK